MKEIKKTGHLWFVNKGISRWDFDNVCAIITDKQKIVLKKNSFK